MNKLVVVGLVCAGLGGATVEAASLFGAKGSFQTSFADDLSYDPTSACHKPYRPFTGDDFDREQYLIEAESYLTCLRSAAQSDQKYAAEVVVDGYEEAVQNFMREVRYGY